MSSPIVRSLLLLLVCAARAEAAFFSAEVQYGSPLEGGRYQWVTVRLNLQSGDPLGVVCFTSSAGDVYTVVLDRPNPCTTQQFGGTYASLILPSSGVHPFVVTASVAGSVIAERMWGGLPGQPESPPPSPAPPPPGRERPVSPGTSPFRPPRATDTTFVATVQPVCQFPSQGTIRIEIPITRVVGEAGADGALVDALEVTRHGVVSPTTLLQIPAFDVDSAGGLPDPAVPEHDLVYVNGRFVGALAGSNNQWAQNTFSVPTEAVHFGTRIPGQSPPRAGKNEIEIWIDQANVMGSRREYYCTAIEWAALSFDALAPTIMVHGNNSSGAFFGESFNERGEQTGFNFIEAFRREKLPFDNSINMPTASVAAHAEMLRTEIPRIAGEFGAKHVHIVAHSKGGLDVRAFLEGPLPPNFGALSVTTLSTPHHGSAGADYAWSALGANALWSESIPRTLFVQMLGVDDGTPELRTSRLAEFNTVNLPRLPRVMTVDGVTRPVVYMSMSADANLDHSRSADGRATIQLNETQGVERKFMSEVAARWLMPHVMTFVYRTMAEVQSVTRASRWVQDDAGNVKEVPVVLQIPTPSYQLNDFLVTINSARITGFREIAPTLDNHVTIGNPSNGYLTIAAIKRTQSLNGLW